MIVYFPYDLLQFILGGGEDLLIRTSVWRAVSGFNKRDMSYIKEIKNMSMHIFL